MAQFIVTIFLGLVSLYIAATSYTLTLRSDDTLSALTRLTDEIEQITKNTKVVAELIARTTENTKNVADSIAAITTNTSEVSVSIANIIYFQQYEDLKEQYEVIITAPESSQRKETDLKSLLVEVGESESYKRGYTQTVGLYEEISKKKTELETRKPRPSGTPPGALRDERICFKPTVQPVYNSLTY